MYSSLYTDSCVCITYFWPSQYISTLLVISYSTQEYWKLLLKQRYIQILKCFCFFTFFTSVKFEAKLGFWFSRVAFYFKWRKVVWHFPFWEHMTICNFLFLKIFRKWLLSHLVSQCPVLQALMRDRRENRDINSQNCSRSTDQPWSSNNSNGHNNHMYHIHLPTAEVNSPVCNILGAEFDTCTLAASKYSCNYYAWNHRTWVMKLILCYSYTVSPLSLFTSNNNNNHQQQRQGISIHFLYSPDSSLSFSF